MSDFVFGLLAGCLIALIVTAILVPSAYRRGFEEGTARCVQIQVEEMAAMKAAMAQMMGKLS